MGKVIPLFDAMKEKGMMFSKMIKGTVREFLDKEQRAEENFIEYYMSANNLKPEDINKMCMRSAISRDNLQHRIWIEPMDMAQEKADLALMNERLNFKLSSAEYYLKKASEGAFIEYKENLEKSGV